MDIKERNKILEENLGIIGKIASKYIQAKGIDQKYEYEDLFQVGCIGALKGIEKYKENYDTKITTQIGNHAKFEIMNYVNRDKYFYKGVGSKTSEQIYYSSLNECIPNTDTKEEYVDVLEDEEIIWDNLDSDIDFYNLCSSMTDRQRIIFKLRFENNLTKTETARVLNICINNVRITELRLIDRIKKRQQHKLGYQRC